MEEESSQLSDNASAELEDVQSLESTALQSETKLEDGVSEILEDGVSESLEGRVSESPEQQAKLLEPSLDFAIVEKQLPSTTQLEQVLEPANTETQEQQALISDQSNQPVDPPAKKEPEVSIVLNPICNDWVMGDDYHLTLPILSTFNQIKERIELEKGICKHRIQLRLKGKFLTSSREKWTLRRLGIFDGFVIQVEPTMGGSWWWNSIDYYIEQLLHNVETALDNAGGGMFLSELTNKVFVTPPLQGVSLRVFLRKYPERIHLHTNTANNSVWVQPATKRNWIPTFMPYPHNLGHYKHYESKVDFNWDDYMDIDDKYKLEEADVSMSVEIPPEQSETGSNENIVIDEQNLIKPQNSQAPILNGNSMETIVEAQTIDVES